MVVAAHVRSGTALVTSVSVTREIGPDMDTARRDPPRPSGGYGDGDATHPQLVLLLVHRETAVGDDCQLGLERLPLGVG
jgi:hypothetical protein